MSLSPRTNILGIAEFIGHMEFRDRTLPYTLHSMTERDRCLLSLTENAETGASLSTAKLRVNYGRRSFVFNYPENIMKLSKAKETEVKGASAASLWYKFDTLIFVTIHNPN